MAESWTGFPLVQRRERRGCQRCIGSGRREERLLVCDQFVAELYICQRNPTTARILSIGSFPIDGHGSPQQGGNNQNRCRLKCQPPSGSPQGCRTGLLVTCGCAIEFPCVVHNRSSAVINNTYDDHIWFHSNVQHKRFDSIPACFSTLLRLNGSSSRFGRVPQRRPGRLFGCRSSGLVRASGEVRRGKRLRTRSRNSGGTSLRSVTMLAWNSASCSASSSAHA